MYSGFLYTHWTGCNLAPRLACVKGMGYILAGGSTVGRTGAVVTGD